MEKEIGYQNWPEMVKITTALVHKKFVFKNYKFSRGLGYLLLLMGFAELIYGLFQSESHTFMNFLNPMCIIVIGLANLVSANAIKWIVENSSWEERFRHKSSINHKFIYIGISLILILCLYGYFISQ